jgi:non-specific serine/threonine protein kinase
VEQSDSMRDYLAPLLDASLLVRDIDLIDGGARYRMLETIREYAWEQLAQSGELDATRQAHAVSFMQVAERYELGDLLPSSANAIERLMLERANLGAALSWLDSGSDTERLLRLVAALGNFWTATAAYREATYWHERALSRSDAGPTSHRAKIQVQLGMARLLQGDIAGAEPHFTAGLSACQVFDEPYYEALALLGLGNAAILQGDHTLGEARLLACRGWPIRFSTGACPRSCVAWLRSIWESSPAPPAISISPPSKFLTCSAGRAPRTICRAS